MDFQILHGDVLNLPLADAGFDSCVTDPPYELGFMGKKWDSSGIAYNVGAWREVFRVLKPGAHLVAFGGTRTYHRMACAIEDAGFEIRDQMQWIYGSGFPKSLDISKAIDKMHGAERERVPNPLASQQTAAIGTNAYADFNGKATIAPVAVTDEAKQWNGWGTALKPANEPICLARKPLEKGLTVAENVLKWRTGALNIDACRIETNGEDRSARYNGKPALGGTGANLNFGRSERVWDAPAGRFPSNVIHDGSDEVVEMFPSPHGAGVARDAIRQCEPSGQLWKLSGDGHRFGDEGSAARFFYCAKATQNDRGDNQHPTVKPTELMQYLCRLITPPNGLILDPFMGSGSTIKAALIERFQCIGIDINAEYLPIAKGRLSELQVKLF